METMALLSHEPEKNMMLSVVKRYSAVVSQLPLTALAAAEKNFKDMCLQGIAYLPGLPGGRQVEVRIAKRGVDTAETYLYADFNIKKNLLYDRKEIPEA